MCRTCERIMAVIERRPGLMVLSNEYLGAAVEDLSTRATLDPRERVSLTLARSELHARCASLN